jgi:hypothetical protein
MHASATGLSQRDIRSCYLVLSGHSSLECLRNRHPRRTFYNYQKANLSNFKVGEFISAESEDILKGRMAA